MRLCVIGDPVGHSLSPRIHRRFMERCGAAGSYEAVTVTAEALEDFVVQGCRGAWDGCNVTMPLKERILPLLDAVEPWTASCGAVNTVCFRNGRAVGYNTDGPGVIESLRLRGFAPSGRAALVLGAREAFACDIDEKCVEVAYENAALNGIDRSRYTVRWGDVLSDQQLKAEIGGGYDMVVANIVADVIIGLSGQVRPFLKEGGLFLCSGIIDDRAEEVARRLREAGWDILRTRQSEGWFSYLCR